jgi:hypothetical protein
VGSIQRRSDVGSARVRQPLDIAVRRSVVTITSAGWHDIYALRISFIRSRRASRTDCDVCMCVVEAGLDG